MKKTVIWCTIAMVIIMLNAGLGYIMDQNRLMKREIYQAKFEYMSMAESVERQVGELESGILELYAEILEHMITIENQGK